MLPKEERKALLLRLFNDETPLVNMTQKQKDAKFPKVETKVEETESPPVDRNSSSPEGGVLERLPISTIFQNYSW
jgi:multisite-specific tRNA:(cytosine-C5)-methyltransferase